MSFVALTLLIVVSLVIGGAGRLIVPRGHSIGLVAAVGIALVGSIAGALVGGLLGLGALSILPELVVSACLVYATVRAIAAQLTL